MKVQRPICVSKYTKTPCVDVLTHAVVYLERYATECDMTVCRRILERNALTPDTETCHQDGREIPPNMCVMTTVDLYMAVIISRYF